MHFRPKNISGRNVEIVETNIRWIKESPWLKIFHHAKTKEVFANESEVMYSLKPGLFSIMRIVNHNFAIDGKYELMIECPKKNNPSINEFVIWRQSHFPGLDDPLETDNEEIEGFQLDPSSTITESIEGNKFGCLAKSNMGYSVFDCVRNPTKWYFSIGILKYDIYGNIPCNDYTSEISLWIRLPNSKVRTQKKKMILKREKAICFMVFMFNRIL